VLRHTGIRIEELLEISHHSLVQHRLPGTRELVPLLQVTPSKTDAERLLLISPDLADVIAAIISRLRGPSGAIPLAARYDRHERRWMPPAPLLFQRRFRGYDQAIQEPTLRDMLAAAITRAGIADPATGQLLSYTPHDFRRMFITDAEMGRIASDATFPGKRDHDAVGDAGRPCRRVPQPHR
jgi:integrase